jgi:hypothetical protein
LKFEWAADLEQRNKLWQARHHIWFAMKALNPGRKVIKIKKKKVLIMIVFIFF